MDSALLYDLTRHSGCLAVIPVQITTETNESGAWLSLSALGGAIHRSLTSSCPARLHPSPFGRVLTHAGAEPLIQLVDPEKN
jgi:hypothetical protein